MTVQHGGRPMTLREVMASEERTTTGSSMTKWLCVHCYHWVMVPIWELGGDCEVKAIAPSPGQKCELFACLNKARSLTCLPYDEYVAKLRANNG